MQGGESNVIVRWAQNPNTSQGGERPLRAICREIQVPANQRWQKLTLGSAIRSANKTAAVPIDIQRLSILYLRLHLPRPLPHVPPPHNPVSPNNSNMGVLESVREPLAEVVAQRGLGVVLGAAFAAFVALSVVLNVLNQALFKNPHEPPVVFHWLPIIGSTITYGMDPYRFFLESQAKVGVQPNCTFEKGVAERLITA